MWYFYGLLASDGYISDYNIELCLNNKDKGILDRLRNIICPEKPLYDKKNTHSTKLTICSKNQLCPKIKHIFNMQSNNKHQEIRFPTNIPKVYIKDFIRGVIDGDGCIDTCICYHSNGNTSVVPRLRILGNYQFLQELNQVSKMFVQHKTNRINKKGAENVWCLTYNSKTAKDLLTWCYSNCNISLQRKYQKFEEVCNIKI